MAALLCFLLIFFGPSLIPKKFEVTLHRTISCERRYEFKNERREWNETKLLWTLDPMSVNIYVVVVAILVVILLGNF